MGVEHKFSFILASAHEKSGEFRFCEDKCLGTVLWAVAKVTLKIWLLPVRLQGVQWCECVCYLWAFVVFVAHPVTRRCFARWTLPRSDGWCLRSVRGPVQQRRFTCTRLLFLESRPGGSTISVHNRCSERPRYVGCGGLIAALWVQPEDWRLSQIKELWSWNCLGQQIELRMVDTLVAFHTESSGCVSFQRLWFQTWCWTEGFRVFSVRTSDVPRWLSRSRKKYVILKCHSISTWNLNRKMQSGWSKKKRVLRTMKERG